MVPVFFGRWQKLFTRAEDGRSRRTGDRADEMADTH
jgi:hypothetical protein